jgi:8-oxo-dGTP diphosphatase
VPGGHREPGETPERTLVRELQEELGVTPTAWRPLRSPRGRAPGHDAPLVLHLYAVTAWTGTPRNRLPEEHTELGWFAVEDACRLSLAHPAYPRLFRRLASATA